MKVLWVENDPLLDYFRFSLRITLLRWLQCLNGSFLIAVSYRSVLDR
jgi:hypothetical protein